MAVQTFFKADIRKSFFFFIIITLGFIALSGSSCDPEQKGRPTTLPATSEQAASSVEDHSVLQPAIDSICRGEFERAGELLRGADAGSPAGQMSRLIEYYDQIEQQRDQKRRAAFEEQLAELETIKETVAAKEVPDVNDIDETMLAVFRAREFAAEDQKAELLNDPFVQKILNRMKANAVADEEQGKWVDAYAHCYYWLAAIFEEDKAYKEKSEELVELSSIELSMQDSSCGETAVERYQGITTEMFKRTLGLLSEQYVEPIDCRQMLLKSLKRCWMLGNVLDGTNESLAWSADADQLAEWSTGLEIFQEQYAQSAEALENVNADTIITVLQDILALNAISLKLPEEVVIAHFSEAALSALDPYTNLIWPWNVKDFEKSMTQQFTGIGIEISQSTGVLTVASLLPDTPAYKSGLDAGDEITEVDGESTEGMTLYCAVRKITGPKGTNVTLTIYRPSTGQTKKVTIKRDRIVVQPVRGWTRDASGEWNYWVDPENRIGYVRLTSFTENSGPDMDEVLRKLEKEGLNGVILDLRFNSGGYLQAAADVVDMFVKEGMIVKSKPRRGLPSFEIARSRGTHPGYPLVVLINGSSASASEIVAGALQDAVHQRATLVGQRSYGKGSVQVVTGFSGGGSQLKYTMAYYHLPSDQRVANRYQIEKEGRTDWGIAPDVEVKMLSNEMKEMVDVQRENDVLARVDHEANGGSTKRYALAETLQADPQLSIGLLVLQSKLIAEGATLNLSALNSEKTGSESVKNDAE